MTNRASPPRLIDHPTHGAAWRAARASELSNERLSENANRLASRLAAGGGASAATSAATIAKIAIPIAVAVAGGYTTFAYVSLNEPSSAPQSEPLRAAPPMALVAPATTGEIEDWKANNAHRARSATTNNLSEEIAMFEAANASAERGRPDLAVEQLEDLLRAYPNTRLRAEIDFGRAEYLARAGHNQKAIRAFSKLARQAAHATRRAEIWRELGDLWTLERRCDRALAAYQRALTEGVPDDQRELIARAIDRCEAD